jgi:hypothetical protein
VNLYPQESEALATTSKYGMSLYSARRDAEGKYIRLATRHMIGTDGVAALAEDLNGDGLPEVLLARWDGFISVLRITDGALASALNAGERTTGMAMLQDRGGKPCLAIGTPNGVQLFGSDYRRVARQSLPVVALAGLGGNKRDCVYTVDAAGAGKVTVLRLQ